MPECELLSKCTFFNIDLYRFPELKKKVQGQYCRASYKKCGYYLLFKAQCQEMKSQIPSGLTARVSS
jgi:hypothetical protein